jgi:hypothetical protein
MKQFSYWLNATNKHAWRYAFDAEIGVKPFPVISF